MGTVTVESKQLGLFLRDAYLSLSSSSFSLEATLNTYLKCCLELLSSVNINLTDVIGVFGETSLNGGKHDCVRAYCAYFTIVSVARLAVVVAATHIVNSLIFDYHSFELDCESQSAFVDLRSCYLAEYYSESVIYL